MMAEEIKSKNPESRMKREPAKSFEDLIVWQRAHQFVLSVYRLTDSFPKQEMYGLTSQLRRAAVSIAANIAEGSTEECRYYLILIRDLGYGDTKSLMMQLEEVSKLLGAYSNSIQNSGS